MQSRDPSLLFLLYASRLNGESDGPWLEGIIEKELQELASELPEWHNTSCLFQNMGDFYVRTATLLARLAERSARGKDILEYATAQIKEMDKENDLSELVGLGDMDDKHESLKAIAHALTIQSDSLNSSWRTSKKLKPPKNRHPSESEMSNKSGSSFVRSIPTSPSTDIHTLSFQQSPIAPTLPHPILPPLGPPPAILEPVVSTTAPSPLIPLPTIRATHIARPPMPPSVALNHIPPLATDSFITAENQVHYYLDTLKQRGTGKHRCPYGISCTKGGKDITFERNSAFRAHLQKHEKRFRCELPGCTARGGFARIDQLRRHQNNVSHKT